MPPLKRDTFGDQPIGLSSPAEDAFEIEASDEDKLPKVTRGILMDAAGALSVTMQSGARVTFPAGMLGAGVIHALRVSKVWSTGSGDQAIVGVV
jgi:hypothetical protein